MVLAELIHFKQKKQQYLSSLFAIIVPSPLTDHVKENKSGSVKQKTTSVCGLDECVCTCVQRASTCAEAPLSKSLSAVAPRLLL